MKTSRRFDLSLYGSAEQTGAGRWIAGLSDVQKQELGRLKYEAHRMKPSVPEEIVADWVEDHGGEREWSHQFSSWPVELTRKFAEHRRWVETLRYYDFRKDWTRKIVPHLGDEELNAVMTRDLNRFTMGRWGRPFTRGMLPMEAHPPTWRLGMGRLPRFWDYVAPLASHWLANFWVRLATLAEPGRGWRIVTSNIRSTVLDSENTLFDMIGVALGADPRQVYAYAAQEGRHLKPGREMRTYRALHYSQE
jgi:hypothetical protein